MTIEQIHTLLQKGLPQDCGKAKLIETHISWVILNDTYVYKIKKPIQYSFLDFSTLEKRKYYCEREIILNRRLTENIYVDVLEVKETPEKVSIVGEGSIIDYAVRMRKVDGERQMDVLLQKDKVTRIDIENLAKKIAAFHTNTTIIYNRDFLDVQVKFNDLQNECDYLKEQLGNKAATIISKAITTSNAFLENNKDLLAARLKHGFFRDCHGDLHSRNIFLLATPQPFDCIEFNDDFRQIDVLNEAAFLCMDLDAFKKQTLSDLFFDCYNSLSNACSSDEDYQLFIYYKSYRANIRAKVNSLRARSATDQLQKSNALKEANKYLELMNEYLQVLLKQPNLKTLQNLT
jgi:uncharacterized protein